MKLKDLLDSAKCGLGELPAGKGFILPQTIELPVALSLFLAEQWIKSEGENREIGGNLQRDGEGLLPWLLRAIGSLMPSGEPGGASAAPNPAAATFTATDVTVSPDGNSVAITPRREANIVANFHTHPPTPGGTNAKQRGYQPPSIEDVLAMQEQASQGRDIFVSFVVAHKRDIHALVYVKGISEFTAENLGKAYEYGGSLEAEGKRIKFPEDADEERYWERVRTKPDRRGHIDLKVERKRNYGEELSKLVWDHLRAVCRVLGIALYRGDGNILRLVDLSMVTAD